MIIIFADFAGIDGLEDMKRIYGITALEGRVKLGRGVKVIFSLCILLFYLVVV
jgi:hypothetical protein